MRSLLRARDSHLLAGANERGEEEREARERLREAEERAQEHVEEAEERLAGADERAPEEPPDEEA